MGNRKAAEAEILKYIQKIIPGKTNVEIYKKRFEALSDKEFEQWMLRLESGEDVLSITVPNLSTEKLSDERNLEVAKELGHNFFQRLWLTDAVTGKTYLTPVKYLVIDLPLRRQVQLLVKKISIPVDNKHIDELSGQATGESKGSKISFPELQVLYAQGLENVITELVKFRGGDPKAFNNMNRSIIENGGVSLRALEKIPTKVTSVTTLSTLLKGMHLDNNL